MRNYYLISTEHLEDKLWFREVDDFVVGMNHVALQAYMCPEVSVLAYILMSNHVHFVLYGTRQEVRDFVNAFKGRYSLYLYRKYGVNAQLRENGLDLKVVSEYEQESLERAIAYVQMNSVAAGICSHPSLYPWGTGNCFFKMSNVETGFPVVTPQYKPLADFSLRSRMRMMHSNMVKTLPPKWLVSEEGYVLPESYVDVDHVEKTFRKSSRMTYFLNSSSKARKRLEADEDRIPSFKDQLILQALPDLLRGLFGKTAFSELSSEADQSEAIRQIRYRFSANVHQAARVCGISYADAARLIDSV